jgi:hypothetical protein
MSIPNLPPRLTAAIILLCAAGLAQDSPPGGVLRSYLQKVALEQLSARKETIASIRTPAQFERRKAYVRRQLLAMMGELPTERSPLNVRKAGAIDRGDYRIEKIIYESLPHFGL